MDPILASLIIAVLSAPLAFWAVLGIIHHATAPETPFKLYVQSVCHDFSEIMAPAGHALVHAFSVSRDLIGTAYRRGWRPLIPWLFVWFCIVLILKFKDGESFGDLPALVTAAGAIGIPTMLAQWTRSKETRDGVANAPRGPASIIIPNGVRV